jgi:aspartate/methionine/tyrosine aminotransferase
MISNRANSIDSSGIRRVFDLAANLKDPINLSIGQPDFDAFEEIKQGAIEAINSQKNGYTVTQGIAPLIEKLKLSCGVSDWTGLDLFVTSGVSGGLLLSYLAMLDPGDEILIPDPFFCMYRDLAMLVNARPVYYDIYPDFKINRETLENLVTEKTRAILVNSPQNPTGYSMSQQELDEIIAFAKSKNIWLIYDEIYSTFCYDSPHASCLNQKGHFGYEKSLVLNGFAKSHGIPGWRMGYAFGPKDLIQAMLKIQQYSFVCSPSIAQWGLLASLETPNSQALEIANRYKEKRDYICQALEENFNFITPNGAFYLFPEAPGGSGQKFVEECIKNNLLAVPGNVFSRRDSHFRISFSTSLETLKRGADVLNKLAQAQK